MLKFWDQLESVLGSCKTHYTLHFLEEVKQKSEDDFGNSIGDKSSRNRKQISKSVKNKNSFSKAKKKGKSIKFSGKFISLPIENTPFRISRRHLVSGAKPQVCSVKACKVSFWFWMKCGSCVMCLCYSHHQNSGWLIKTKTVAWEPICQEIFCFNLHGQTLIFCWKSLTVKFDVKYLFTT